MGIPINTAKRRDTITRIVPFSPYSLTPKEISTSKPKILPIKTKENHPTAKKKILAPKLKVKEKAPAKKKEVKKAVKKVVKKKNEDLVFFPEDTPLHDYKLFHLLASDIDSTGFDEVIRVNPQEELISLD